MNVKFVKLALSHEDHIVRTEACEGCYSLKALLTEVREPAVVLIDGLNPENSKSMRVTFKAIYELRRSSVFYAAPIFLAKSMDNLNIFVDGIGSTPEEVLPTATKILARMDGLSIEKNAVSDDLRVLTYLYCRGDDQVLLPVAMACSPWIYEYPAAYLIGGFAGTNLQTAIGIGLFADKDLVNAIIKSSAEWLITLAAQGVLIGRELVDRIRLCTYCGTGNLNYIDFCPLCGSIDFHKRKMIHCFTCSHVAPEENFKNGMMFVCPRCNTNLRHIGSDYDRPMESYSCDSCGERFIDPEVKAVCMRCRHKSPTDELVVRQLYTYSLTPKGKRAVQVGNVDLEFSLFDSNRNVMPQYFYQITDWLIQMKARYSEEDFSLLCIKIEGFEGQGTTTGIAQFQKMVNELAVRIRELVRLTDITTSTGSNTFWVLLPRTNLSGGEILASRVAKLAELISGDNGEHIAMQTKCFSIPEEYASRGQVAEMLLKEYEAALANKK
ncbi:MAG: response regulator receiver protein [Firmicutes bacterium]|nr:response regulator receiver protein [Bacillota bacterium]